MTRLTLVAAAAALSASSAWAAEAPASSVTFVQQNADAAAKYKQDFSVPAAPAFTIMGATPSGELTSHFGGDLQWEALNLGGDLPSFGVTARPYWLTGHGDRMTRETYMQAPWWEKRAASTVLSFAFGASGQGDKPPAAAGLGVHTSLLSAGDPRLDDHYWGCIRAVQEATAPKSFMIKAKASSPPAPAPVAGPAQPTFALLSEAARARLIYLAQAAAPAGRQVLDATTFGGIQGLGRTTNDAELKAAYVKQLTHANWVQAAAEQDYEDLKSGLGFTPPPPAPSPQPFPSDPDTLAGVEIVKVEEPEKKGEGVGACASAARVRYLNEPEWLLGLGERAVSTERRLGDLDFGGTHIWTSYRIPLGRRDEGCDQDNARATDAALVRSTPKGKLCTAPLGTLTLFGRYIVDDKIVLSKTSTEQAETLIMGASLKKDASDGRWSIAASAAYNERNWKNAAFDSEDFWRIALETSIRVSPGVFLSTQWGTVTNSPRGEDDFAIVRLNVQK